MHKKVCFFFRLSFNHLDKEAANKQANGSLHEFISWVFSGVINYDSPCERTEQRHGGKSGVKEIRLMTTDVSIMFKSIKMDLEGEDAGMGKKEVLQERLIA